MWAYNNTSELYHHGILGMKWGRRSGSTKVTSGKKSHYNSTDRARDILVYGKKSQKRIEDKVNSGHSKTVARGQEMAKTILKGWVASAVVMDIGSGGAIHRAAGEFIKQETVKAGNKFVASYMAKKAAKSIVKIAQNPKFNPIDVAYTIVG